MCCKYMRIFGYQWIQLWPRIRIKTKIGIRTRFSIRIRIKQLDPEADLGSLFPTLILRGIGWGCNIRIRSKNGIKTQNKYFCHSDPRDQASRPSSQDNDSSRIVSRSGLGAKMGNMIKNRIKFMIRIKTLLPL